jgi:hypothetical protein
LYLFLPVDTLYSIPNAFMGYDSLFFGNTIL